MDDSTESEDFNREVTYNSPLQFNLYGVKIKVNGVWKSGTVYIRVNGVWRKAHYVETKQNNSWKISAY